MGDVRNLPVTVYRWDDVGAPQLFGYGLDLINVFKKCLVDGYGDKSSLGWTMPFVDDSQVKAVFRNSQTDGTGGYFQIWDADGVNSKDSTLSMRPAKSMTGLDQFIMSGHSHQLYVASRSTRWVLVGTSRGFYFQALDGTKLDNTYYYSNVFFVGDFDSYIINDPSSFTIFMGTRNYDSTNISESDTVSSPSNNQIVCKLYDTDGHDGWAAYSIQNIISYHNDVSMKNATFDDYTNVWLSPLVLHCGTTPTSSDRNGIKLFASSTRPYIRGEFVGALWTANTGYMDAVSPTIVLINNEAHIGFSHKYNLGFWVNTEVWYV